MPEKNLALLFELMGHLSKDEAHDYRLVVVGDGIDRSYWEKFCRKRIPTRVTFLGHIKDREILADLYANVDAFVHPNDREPFGIAPLEAMASGTPLIAPNAGGVTSYANSENAWTVSAAVENFAAAVREAIENNQLREEKIALALTTARRYCWDKVAPLFLDLYSELHRLAHAPAESLPAASFESTGAQGADAAVYHTVSRTAESMFRFVSALTLRRRHSLVSRQ